MTTFDISFSLPDNVANEARTAGLLAPEAIARLIESDGITRPRSG